MGLTKFCLVCAQKRTHKFLGFESDEVAAGRVVFVRGDDGIVQPFGFVRFGFVVKHVVVEQPLELFVGKVDAKLLERVNCEYFESKNVQNPNE